MESLPSFGISIASYSSKIKSYVNHADNVIGIIYLEDEDIIMNISSAAGFLINRAVRLASGLDQGGQGGASRSPVPTEPAKTLDSGAEKSTTMRSSAAYRVTLSSSALRQGAMESVSA
jgi:hypothetical protein